MKRSNELIGFLVRDAVSLKEFTLTIKSSIENISSSIFNGSLYQKIAKEFAFLFEAFTKFGASVLTHEIIHLRIQYLFQIINIYLEVSILVVFSFPL